MCFEAGICIAWTWLLALDQWTFSSAISKWWRNQRIHRYGTIDRRYSSLSLSICKVRFFRFFLQLFNGIHIAVALIYNSKLYTCNVGQCRIILCKTDNNNVLRAVQMSADYDNTANTNNSIGETILSRLEIVGPIPLNETHRFLVLMSFGLCKTLDKVYNDENNINRELIQAIVQQFRVQPSLAAVAQTVIERIVSEHYTNYVEHNGDRQINGRADLTLMIRNFNFSLPNEGHSPATNQVMKLVWNVFGSISFHLFHSRSIWPTQ